MTKLEALQAMVEYENDNLLSKVLIDRELTGTDTYAATDAGDIELCAADVYMMLATHPELKEGSRTVKYSASVLRSMALEIYQKHDEGPNTIDGTELF
jgi:hypothetical protein